MSLQFIIGNSGAGKSFRAYQRVIREAACLLYTSDAADE